jgi:hypothetical protein
MRTTLHASCPSKTGFRLDGSRIGAALKTALRGIAGFLLGGMVTATGMAMRPTLLIAPRLPAIVADASNALIMAIACAALAVLIVRLLSAPRYVLMAPAVGFLLGGVACLSLILVGTLAPFGHITLARAVPLAAYMSSRGLVPAIAAASMLLAARQRARLVAATPVNSSD